jgi:hypothetical protein
MKLTREDIQKYGTEEEIQLWESQDPLGKRIYDGNFDGVKELLRDLEVIMFAARRNARKDSTHYRWQPVFEALQTAIDQIKQPYSYWK